MIYKLLDANNQTLIPDIKVIIIINARDKAIRKVDIERTIMYWHIGKRIFEEEQSGKIGLIVELI